MDKSDIGSLARATFASIVLALPGCARLGLIPDSVGDANITEKFDKNDIEIGNIPLFIKKGNDYVIIGYKGTTLDGRDLYNSFVWGIGSEVNDPNKLVTVYTMSEIAPRGFVVEGHGVLHPSSKSYIVKVGSAQDLAE
jgi:hypothetical protein